MIGTRGWMFIYTVAWFIALFVMAGLYIERPELASQWIRAPWEKAALHAVWFGILGGVAISFKGIYDHYHPSEWAGHRWTHWYLGRPLNGAIVGVVTYVALHLATPNTSPSLPALAVAAFILGTQERRFFGFLAEIGKTVLNVPGDAPAGFAVKEIAPTTGHADLTP
ncbi:MAG: hypothetical protein ACREPA_10500 [Candidatus Dormibacteraceae bacterium]